MIKSEILRYYMYLCIVVRNNIKTTCELINVLHFLCYILIMNPFITGHRALEKKQITQGNNRKIQNPSGSPKRKRVTKVTLFLFVILVYIMMNVGAERLSPKMKNAPQVCCLSTRLRGLFSLFLELSLKK